ncbi:hypothetical protein A2870_03090 [Candidatus Curtissbacteria bacterium RIFCSPHIGHO2_01_FULL_41_11]|uniref:Uncharacterized protein n=1 Tax=Candidatus Curtissbacteria bacterium RIFCSPHIGHO2_01_FULL_41_11 TaxID=1797711 RepID=A0A1F5G6Y0_9BACT|nr:MAG: hypothetical protein A2870_03090 [Candidatus Curtissbacteria bacterium RIFCSPHIGHO2_01_FULL_41_11]
MSVEDLSIAVTSVVINAIADFVNFIPALVGGLVVLVIGLVLGAVAYRLVIGVLKAVQLEKFLSKYGITSVEGRDIEWSEVLAEITRWAIIVVFLIPTFQAWRLDSVNVVLNRVVFYVPNVIVSVVLAIVGLVFSKLAYRVAKGASHSLGRTLSHAVGITAQWSITVFVAFLVLHQLGVGQELLRILFGGIVAMIAIAGGLAFGLGGQTTAREILESVWEKFKK